MDFKQWLLEFSQTKVGMIVCICAGVIVLAVIILANTSIGRKSLIKLATISRTAKESSDKASKDIVEYKGKVDERVEELTEKYEKKLAVVEKHNEDLEELLIAIAGCINNKKVKSLIKDYAKLDTENVDTDKILEEIEKVAEND